jgi:hypothetical protein
MRTFTEDQLYDGVKLRVRKEELQRAGVPDLCKCIETADRLWLMQWSKIIEVMGSWDGDSDCIKCVTQKENPELFRRLQALY